MGDSLGRFVTGGIGGGGVWSGGISMIGDTTIGVDAFFATDLAITTNGIGGVGTLTKVGNGELALFVDSTYAGDTLITDGGVAIFTDAALSAGFQTVVSDEATLNVDTGLAVDETLVIAGDGSNNYNDGFGRPAGALTLINGSTSLFSTWLGTITLDLAGASIGAVAGKTLILGNDPNDLVGPTGTVLSKVERGRVRITRANNTYLGTTRIDNGTLEIADAAALGAGDITVNATTGAQPAIGTLQVEGNFTLAQTLTLNGAGDSTQGAVHVVAPAGSGRLGFSTITVSGSVVLNSTTNLNVDPLSTLTVSGVISDVVLPQPAELNKLGGGTLVLSGTNTYTGQTVLRDGVTSIRSPGALGSTAAGTSVNTGAVLSLDGGLAGLPGLTVTGEALSIAGSAGFSPSTVRAGSGANVWAGPINFIDNQGAPLNIEAASGATLELQGSLGGGASIHKVGTGTVSFTGAIANTIFGTIFVDGGTLALGNTGGNATNAAVVVGDGVGPGTDELRLLAPNQLNDNRSVTVNVNGLFNLNGFNDTIGGAGNGPNAGALTIAGGRVQTGAGVLSLNGDVNTFGAGGATNIDGNIDGNVFLTATRTFLFLPTPQMTIRSLVNSSQFGNEATFIVTMFPFSSGALVEPTVEGTVTFFDGDTRIGDVRPLQPDITDPTGRRTQAAVFTTALSGGLHTIRAVYSGSNFYAPSSVTLGEQQAVRNTPVFATLTSSNLTAEPNPNLLIAPSPSQSVTFTYRALAPVGSIAPTGTVTFFDNGVPIGTAQTLTPDGFAYATTSFPIPTTAAERLHTITATYSGDLFFSSNTVTLSAPDVPTALGDPDSVYTRPVSQQVGFDPLVQLTTDFNAVSGDRSATINFQARGEGGQPTPAGTVQFFVDGSPVGTPLTVDANGRAAITLGNTASQVVDATWAAGVATITTDTPHHLETGNTVTLTDLTPAGYNGTFVVTRVSDTQFTYTLVAPPGAFVPPSANGVVITDASWSGGFTTVTTSGGHGLAIGDPVTIAGVTPGGYNGTFLVTDVLPPAFPFDPSTQFRYALASSPGTYVEGIARRIGVGVSNASWTMVNGGTATITTGAVHNLNSGDTVTISGLDPAGYNGTFVITRLNANQFSYSLQRSTSPGTYINGGTVLRTGAAITTASWAPTAGGTVTATTTGAHNLEDGDVVTLTGITRPGYNGTFTVSRVSDTQFSYGLADDPGAFITNNPLPAANATIATMTWNRNTRVVTVNTTAAHNFQSGDRITITTTNTASAAGDPIPAAAAEFEGTHVVTRVDADTFTYVLQLNPGQFVSTPMPPSARSQVNRTVIDASWNAGIVTIQTDQPHGLAAGSQVVLTGLNPNGYNGVYTVLDTPTGDTYRFNLAGNPGLYVAPTVTNTVGGLQSRITNATWVGGTVTITTASAHGLTTGQTASISGVTPPGYNGGPFTVTVLNGNTFSFNQATNPGAFVRPNSNGTVIVTITNAAWANGVVTADTANTPANPLPFVTGQVVTITGASPAGYNGTFTITVVDFNTFTYPVTNDPGPFFMGTSNGTASRAALSVSNTFATVTPATLGLGEHEVRAEFRSTDAVFTDARATLSVPEAGSFYTDNMESNTPVVYQLLSSRTAVQISTIGNDDPFITDPASFTFRVNTNDAANYQNGSPSRAGNTFHPTPTGTVTFRDPARGIIGTVDIGKINNLTGPPGEATLAGITFPRSQFGPGTTTITATYSGDDYYAGRTLTVVQGLLATNTPVKLSTNRSVALIGETVEFTVDASTLAAMNIPAIGDGFVNLVATNTVTGATVPAMPPLQFTLGNRGVRGVGVGSLTFTVPGTYTVSATFVPTTNVIGGATVMLNPTLTVVAPFDAVLTSNRVPSAPTGSDVTFTFRSTVATNAGTGASGIVEFYDGINKIGTTQILNADGTASITLNTLATGTHTISAVFTPPNGSPYQVTRVFMDEVQVVGTPPVVDINTSSSTVVDGDPVTIQVTARGALGIPAGRVDLFANGFLLVSGVLVRNGVATFTTNLPAGRYTIDARYSGDPFYAPIVSTMTQDLVVISPTRFQVRSSANANVNGTSVNYPVVGGTAVTYTAELRTNSTAPNNPLPDATGSVTFNLVNSAGAVVASTGPVDLVTVVQVIDATVTLRTPTAVGTLTAPAFVPGGDNNYRVVAVYNSDQFYTPQESSFDQPVVATAADLPAAAPVATTANRLVPTLNVNGSIRGGSTTGLVSSATGTLVLNGSSTYGGSTLITGAGNTVVLGVNDALPDTTALTVTAGTLNANGRTDTVGSLAGTGTVQLPAGSVFTAGSDNTSTIFSGTITGAGTLSKVGTGTLFLIGSSTGTNTVVVNAGTLGGAGAAGGNGTVVNAVVNPGATLAPGATPAGTAFMDASGSVTFAAGSTFAVQANGPAVGTQYDQLAVTGTATLNGATLAFTPSAAFGAGNIGNTFTILTAGSVVGTFAGLPNNGTFITNSRQYRVNYTATAVTVTLVGLAADIQLASTAGSPNPSSPGQPVSFTATISAQLASDGRPTGSVQFFDGSTPLGAPITPLTMVNGTTSQAVLNLPAGFATAGPRTITAVYTSNNNFGTLTSAPLVQVVSVASTTTLQALSGPSNFGDSVGFVARVARVTGLPSPTGTVNFFAVTPQGAVFLGSAQLDGTGGAGFNTTAIRAGTNTIRADYLGDGFYRPSSATAVQIVDRKTFIVVGADAGPTATVRVYDALTGAKVNELNPFDGGYRGGVKVGSGDVNNDGTADVIVSAGAGAPGGHVRVFSGVDGSLLASFLTFPGYTPGVNISAGDVDGDGFSDVVVGTSIVNDHVKVYSGRTLVDGGGGASDGTFERAVLQSFFAYGGGNPTGVTVGAGDIDGDGRADVITGTATLATHVKAFSGASGAELASFFAFESGFVGGVNVAGGDTNNDGFADLIVGKATTETRVKVIDGRTRGETANFLAFPARTSGCGSGRRTASATGRRRSSPGRPATPRSSTSSPVRAGSWTPSSPTRRPSRRARPASSWAAARGRNVRSARTGCRNAIGPRLSREGRGPIAFVWNRSPGTAELTSAVSRRPGRT